SSTGNVFCLGACEHCRSHCLGRLVTYLEFLPCPPHLSFHPSGFSFSTVGLQKHERIVNFWRNAILPYILTLHARFWFFSYLCNLCSLQCWLPVALHDGLNRSRQRRTQHAWHSSVGTETTPPCTVVHTGALSESASSTTLQNTNC